MKKLIIFLSLLQGFFATTQAQTNYYDCTKIIQGDGYAYQCKLDNAGRIYLYNVENILTDTYMQYKDGRPVQDGFDSRKKITINDKAMYKTMHDIICMGFTKEEAQSFKDAKRDLTVELYFDSDSGYIWEVKFSFFYTAPYIYIPIEKFREIEMELKRKVHYETTEEGKSRNYVYMWWSDTPTGGMNLE